MASKTHDLSVKLSTFTGRNGSTQNKWLPIGAVLEGIHGPFIVLDRHINLAGLPGNGPVTVNMFPVNSGSPNQDEGLKLGPEQSLDDEIPF